MANELKCSPEQLRALLDGQMISSERAMVSPAGPPRQARADHLPAGPPLAPMPFVEYLPYPDAIAPGVSFDGLKGETLDMMGVLFFYAHQRGYHGEVTSAFRSPAYQAQLRARWDRGERSGLLVRPALSSAHSRGEALDIIFSGGRPGLTAQRDMGNYAIRRGYVWGGTWSRPDPVHFALQNTGRIE